MSRYFFLDRVKGDTYTFPTSHSSPLCDVKHVHNRKFIHAFRLIKMRIEKNFKDWYLETITQNGYKFSYYFLFLWIFQLTSNMSWAYFNWRSIQNYTIFPWKSMNVELKPWTAQHRNIEKALGKTSRRLEKKQKSKTNAWEGSYMVLG